MADRGAAHQRLSRKDKGKAKVGEPSDYTSEDDQSEEFEPGPDSENNLMVIDDQKELVQYNPPNPHPGSLPNETMCLSIVLISQEVAEAYPKLILSASEAFNLTDRMELLEDPTGRFSEDLAMTDVLDNLYRMKISNHNSGSPSRFLVNTDWSKFVRLNQLKEGDVLKFYRLLDPVSGQPWYALRHFKNPGNVQSFSFSDDNQSRRLLPGPEPSVVPPSDIVPSLEEKNSVLSKTLTSLDTEPIDPMLSIDASEAYALTGCVNLFRPSSVPNTMELFMYNDDDDSYKMLLYYCPIDGCYLSRDWGRFVKRNKLKAGDQVLFYRHQIADGVDPVYELKPVKREEPKIIAQPLKLIDLNTNPIPGPRGISVPLTKLTKTLYADQGNVLRICFDGNEAWILTFCSRVLKDSPCGTLVLNLLVYDEDDRPYDMVLTHLKRDDGTVVCTLDVGWHRFVESHGLRAGDEVTICSIKRETYYTIGYTRAALPSVTGASGVGPTGSGQ
ncbi:hypothetical protein CASFOL_005711 [Castilleja foliolosa]|uniref:TF-B3 domain-containing protein n=1 Tax=Castilleja foliolosa TaxID=1961234 RepID=A0ABD3E4L0_9LAMI